MRGLSVKFIIVFKFADQFNSMEEESFYRNLQQALDELPENFTILEEQVDVTVQMSYYNLSSRIKKQGIPENYEDYMELVFDPAISLKEKKKMLATLASVDEVFAFRALEKYMKEPDPGLRDWAILALQESRMRLQSSLLDEQQVFISTGLGGKGKKLRYFIVFLNSDGTIPLNKVQQKLLRTEVAFALEKKDGEVESFDFMEGYSACTAILPLKADLGTIFHDIITECNQYGSFLQEDLVITNVRKLRKREIRKMLEGRKEQP